MLGGWENDGKSREEEEEEEKEEGDSKELFASGPVMG